MINEKNALFGFRYNNPAFAQNRAYDHPANAFARSQGALNWDHLIEKMRNGFVAVGRMPVRPSKSSIGVMLFVNVVNSVEGLLMLSDADDIGQMVIGFREHLPADLLAEHDARVKKQEERMLGWLETIKKASKDPSVHKVMIDSYSQFEKQSEAAHAFECEQPSENAEVVHDAEYHERTGFYSTNMRHTSSMKNPQVQSISRSRMRGCLTASSGGGRSKQNPLTDKTTSNSLLAGLLRKLK